MKRPPDMSQDAFNKALRERDWQKVLFWIDIGHGTSVGMVMVNGRINRRASLAHAIRRAAEIEKQKEKQS